LRQITEPRPEPVARAGGKRKPSTPTKRDDYVKSA